MNSKKIVALMLMFTMIFTSVHAIGLKDTDIKKATHTYESFFPSNYTEIIWMKTFGGRWRDDCWSVIKTLDNGYLLIGETTSFDKGGGDAWLVKLDANGNELWNKSYGGSEADYAFDGVQTLDGGYVIVGGTKTFTKGDHDVWLFKTDEYGNEQWNRSFGGAMRDQGYAIIESSDNGFVICGGSGSFTEGPNDYWIIKIDEQGTMLWNLTYGDKGYDWGYDIIETVENTYVFTGGTDTSRDYSHILDIGIVEVDSLGNLIWDESFNNPPAKNRWDEGYSIINTRDGGLLIAGIAHTYHWAEDGEGDGWIIKTDRQGHKMWDRSYGGDLCDGFSTVKRTEDGGYVVSGWTYSYGAGDANIWLLKLDSDGFVDWDLTIGEEDYEWSMLHTLEIAQDDSYIVVGTTKSFGAGSSDMFIAKLGDPFISIDFTGGLGFSFELINDGVEDFNNISWNIDISNSVLYGVSSQGMISSLYVGESFSVMNHNLIVGFGEGTIRFSIGNLGKTVHCLFIGPFVFKT